MSRPPWRSRIGIPVLSRFLIVVVFAITVGPGAHAEPTRRKSPPNAKTAHKSLEKSAIPATRGKVAVFVFRGDDGDSLRTEVVHVLRARGLDVMTSLRPVDSAAQFREMADTLDLAMYVEGEIRSDGRKENAVVRVRSGRTGMRTGSATFSGAERKVSEDVARTLWSRIGAAVVRACADAARPRRHERSPLRIEAGTPIETTSAQAQEGT